MVHRRRSQLHVRKLRASLGPAPSVFRAVCARNQTTSPAPVLAFPPSLEPDQLLLRPSKLKYSLILFVSVVFTAAGLVVLVTSSVLGGLAVAGFFGVCTVMSVFLVFGRRTYLLLNREGFTLSGLFGRRTIPWSRVESFSPDKRWVSVRYLDHDGLLPDTYGLGARRLAVLLTEWKARYTSTT